MSSAAWSVLAAATVACVCRRSMCVQLVCGWCAGVARVAGWQGSNHGAKRVAQRRWDIARSGVFRAAWWPVSDTTMVQGCFRGAWVWAGLAMRVPVSGDGWRPNVCCDALVVQLRMYTVYCTCV